VFWLIYSHGLVTKDRGNTLADHKIHFAREDNNGQQFKLLEEVVNFLKPSCLVGLCTIGGVFTSRSSVRRRSPSSSLFRILPASRNALSNKP
jgi:malate dehydrogenase (oxaloacetate-decarboxylating)(NADP+)